MPVNGIQRYLPRGRATARKYMNSICTIKAPTTPGSTAAYAAVTNGTNVQCRFKEGSTSPFMLGDGSSENSFRYPAFFFDDTLAVVWSTDQRIEIGSRAFQVLKWTADETYSVDIQVQAVEVTGLE